MAVSGSATEVKVLFRRLEMSQQVSLNQKQSLDSEPVSLPWTLAGRLTGPLRRCKCHGVRGNHQAWV